MKNNIISSIRLTIVMLILFSGAYTLIVWASSQLTTSHGNGDVIYFKGKKFYSNLGQKFTNDRYFNSRPSAVEYNAASSAGSNKGPSNPAYLASVQARIDTFIAHNPKIKKSEIPSDLVTASGSGLDPHISVTSALIQINRISKVRGISENALTTLISKQTEKPMAGLFGPERIHVLKLNIELDKMQ
ncbi:K(+)-transporting ATPase subunit C [Cytophagaceae bacterium 50C-KIRBA]|uniref:Potassium-transporting ATPase KdpC subunit n=1 Tax=Aquirufa beregesia TaxID=2516556 RepID=A0ABX0ET49_9BACT|nr:K(+)-transporting ATPase subunit C [Aquirufa beregesia]NGZ43646.1 K(+)-transporting ATPase subunit C [Aquirufa beregesia]